MKRKKIGSECAQWNIFLPKDDHYDFTQKIENFSGAFYSDHYLACTTDRTKTLVKSVRKTTHHDFNYAPQVAHQCYYQFANQVKRKFKTPFSGGPRPSDKEGGHPDPEIREAWSPKKLFSALWASVWSKNKGGPPLDPPLHFQLFIEPKTWILLLLHRSY